MDRVDRICLARDCADLDPPASDSDAGMGRRILLAFPLNGERQGMEAMRIARRDVTLYLFVALGGESDVEGSSRLVPIPNINRFEYDSRRTIKNQKKVHRFRLIGPN